MSKPEQKQKLKKHCGCVGCNKGCIYNRPTTSPDSTWAARDGGPGNQPVLNGCNPYKNSPLMPEKKPVVSSLVNKAKQLQE